LLGTHSRADSLAVAMGPLDTLNSVLINSMVFAFVPMLAAKKGIERAALFGKLRRGFVWIFLAISSAVVAGAPWLMRILGPGLDPESFRAAVTISRILALSTTAAGLAALYWALLYTERRFAPTAFYQATINVCTIVAAVTLWRELGVYAFAIGYASGACVQLAAVHHAARRALVPGVPPRCDLAWPLILRKPVFFLVYAAGLSLNATFTRAYATHAGPGMAAAFEYCMRCVGVPLALLVNPLANSLLPEIARLKQTYRLPDAFRLISRTLLLAALIAALGCGFALLLRERLIALVFERGNFTRASTLLVSSVFLGLGPALVGWSLMEIAARSLFALNRPWPPIIAAVLPVLVNAALTLHFHWFEPRSIGFGASIGVAFGFAVLLLTMRANRRRWLEEY
ncbi:MAG: hypothetical protein JO323_24305, partial [Acidobacteriia bacterium]|nr:hypothetical protein [Terriglobia bacterium]